MDDYVDTSVDRNAIETASSFFFIAALCVGIPTLFWSLHSLYVCRKNGGRTSVFVVFLLLNVPLQLAFSTPFIMNNFHVYCLSRGCVRTIQLFLMTDLCGIYFHLLVALESILALRHPLYIADLFSPVCSITISVTTYVLFFIASFASLLNLMFIAPSFGLLVVMFIFTFKAPPSPCHIPDSDRKQRKWVLAVATITLVALYLPSLVTESLLNTGHYSQSLGAANAVVFSMRSLRVVCDTLLGVLVCKKLLPVQLPQTQPEEHDLSRNCLNVITKK